MSCVLKRIDPDGALLRKVNRRGGRPDDFASHRDVILMEVLLHNLRAKIETLSPDTYWWLNSEHIAFKEGVTYFRRGVLALLDAMIGTPEPPPFPPASWVSIDASDKAYLVSGNEREHVLCVIGYEVRPILRSQCRPASDAAIVRAVAVSSCDRASVR